jgi:predicted dehydrogenase
LNEQWESKYKHLKFCMVFQYRTMPIWATVRRLIADGELGDISRITFVVTDQFRTWAYYASGGWRATWEGEGGGALLNQCPHFLDLLQWVPNLMPRRVTAVASIAKTHPIEVEDDVSAILEYDNGAIGHFICNTGEAPGTQRLEIAGDRGQVVVERNKISFRRTRKAVQEFSRTTSELFPSMETWDIDVPSHGPPGGHKLVLQNFVDHILKNQPLFAHGTEGIRSLEIGNAMLMSGITRKPVELPLSGAAYDAFLADITRKYKGKKTLAVKEKTLDAAEMAESWKK